MIVVESGEAVRVGDDDAVSGKKESSLCITSGHMFGAEEVRVEASINKLLGTYSYRPIISKDKLQC